MNQLRRLLATIKDQLGGMSASQKLLIGSLAVIMAMTLFVVAQYTGQADLVTVIGQGEPMEAHSEVASFLDANHIPYESDAQGRPVVAPGQKRMILARLSEQGKLPGNTVLTFNELIDRQSWTQTHTDKVTAERVALQNELALVIGQMSGITRASVMIDAPQARIGQPHRAPTASATVWASGGLDRNTVDAVAHLIASSRSGLTVDRVRVIDGTNNRQFRARSDEDMIATDALELTVQHEERSREKIYDALSAYIPGVIVTVQAQVDATRVSTRTTRVAPDGQGSATLVKLENTEAAEEQQATDAGEAGVRSNVEESIRTANAGGNTSTEEAGLTEFDTMFGHEQTSVIDGRGFATKINAVVNIPRPYFVELWRSEQPAPPAQDGAADEQAQAEPTADELDVVRNREFARIQQEVELLIDTSVADNGQPGEVLVSEIPVMPDLFGAGAGGAAQAGGGTFLGIPMGGASGGDVVRTLGLGGLAVLSLGLVVMTALKSNKREELPSASELVGIPPELGQEEDLVGEAMEADSTMLGLELSGDDLEKRKRMEQIASMIEEHPEEAAGIIKRWVSESEY